MTVVCKLCKLVPNSFPVRNNSFTHIFPSSFPSLVIVTYKLVSQDVHITKSIHDHFIPIDTSSWSFQICLYDSFNPYFSYSQCPWLISAIPCLLDQHLFLELFLCTSCKFSLFFLSFCVSNIFFLRKTSQNISCPSDLHSTWPNTFSLTSYLFYFQGFISISLYYLEFLLSPENTSLAFIFSPCIYFF